MIKYFLLWFPMLALAIVNGFTRDLGYKKHIGELAAHQVSTFSLILMLGVYIYFVIGRFPPKGEIQALLVGLLWMSFTLLFEFGFGFMRGNSWKQLLYAYNLAEGQLWILIPIWIIMAPYIAFKIRKANN